MKTCTSCGREKDLSEYYFNKARNKHKGRCKSCDKTSVKIWRKKNPEAQSLINKRGRVKWAYGLCLDDVKEFGECPICLKEKRLVIDHCHNKGHVRGFICYSCNTLLGHIENKDKMARVQRYLEEKADPDG